MLLVLETSLSDIRLAICHDNGELLREKLVVKGRGEILDALLSECLDECQLKLTDINEILVSIGPGSFTGLRTGIAFAQGLCFGGNRILKGISTLAALSRLAPSTAKTAVVLRARPSMEYVGVRLANEEKKVHLSSEAMISTDELVEYIKECEYLVIDSNRKDYNELVELISAHNSLPQIIDLSKEFTISSWADCALVLENLEHAKPNYLQKSYAEQ